MNLGAVSLNLSVVLYLFYFFPQLAYNELFKRTGEISLATQTAAVVAAALDFAQGFGLGYPWEYKLVSSVSCVCVLFQEGQMWVQSKSPIQEQSMRPPTSKKIPLITVHFFLSVLGTAVLCVVCAVRGLRVRLLETFPYILETFGFANNILYSAQWVPQLWCNFRRKSAEAQSLLYLLLLLAASACDFVSAICLDWQLPQKMQPVLTALLVAGLLGQRARYYRAASSSPCIEGEREEATKAEETREVVPTATQGETKPGAPLLSDAERFADRFAEPGGGAHAGLCLAEGSSNVERHLKQDRDREYGVG